MGADTATPGRSVLGRRRIWAWMALAGFAGLVVVVAAVVVLSGESFIGLVFTAVCCLLLGGAALWWAFTTRKVWKRWLNLALLVLVVVTLVISLVAFSLWQAAGGQEPSDRVWQCRRPSPSSQVSGLDGTLQCGQVGFESHALHALPPHWPPQQPDGRCSSP